jgi:hypothetical protein
MARKEAGTARQETEEPDGNRHLDCLGSAKKPNDKQDDKNGADNAAADVHENLSLKDIGSSSEHDWRELSVH